MEGCFYIGFRPYVLWVVSPISGRLFGVPERDLVKGSL